MNPLNILRVAALLVRRPAAGAVHAAVLLLLTVFGSCSEKKPEPQTKEQALIARLAENPSDVNARIALAHHYYDTNNPRQAIPVYKEVLKRRPNELTVRTDLGTCYKRIGNLESAQAEYERVIREQPKHIQAIYNLAVVLYLGDDPKRAAELWEQVAEISPDPNTVQQALKNAAEARQKAASDPPK